MGSESDSSSVSARPRTTASSQRTNGARSAGEATAGGAPTATGVTGTAGEGSTEIAIVEGWPAFAQLSETQAAGRVEQPAQQPEAQRAQARERRQGQAGQHHRSPARAQSRERLADPAGNGRHVGAVEQVVADVGHQRRHGSVAAFQRLPQSALEDGGQAASRHRARQAVRAPEAVRQQELDRAPDPGQGCLQQGALPQRDVAGAQHDQA